MRFISGFFQIVGLEKSREEQVIRKKIEKIIYSFISIIIFTSLLIEKLVSNW